MHSGSWKRRLVGSFYRFDTLNESVSFYAKPYWRTTRPATEQKKRVIGYGHSNVTRSARGIAAFSGL